MYLIGLVVTYRQGWVEEEESVIRGSTYGKIHLAHPVHLIHIRRAHDTFDAPAHSWLSQVKSVIPPTESTDS